MYEIKECNKQKIMKYLGKASLIEHRRKAWILSQNFVTENSCHNMSQRNMP